MVYETIRVLHGNRNFILKSNLKYAFGLDEMFLESAKDSLVPADAKALEDPVLVKWNNKAIREGLRQGSVALAVENALFWQDWGFQFSNIEYESLSIWHGEKDVNAPSYLAHYACDHIPKVNSFAFVINYIIRLIANFWKMKDICSFGTKKTKFTNNF